MTWPWIETGARRLPMTGAARSGRRVRPPNGGFIEPPQPSLGLSAGRALTPRLRLALAAIVVVTLLVVGTSAALHLGPVRAWSVSVFLLIELGVAPCLLIRHISILWFATLALASSIAGTLAIGFTMAITHVWLPFPAFVAVASVTLALLIPSVRRDLPQALATAPRRAPFEVGHRSGRRRGAVIVCALTALGLIVIVADAATHRGDPQPGGLFTTLGPIWYLGLALIISAVAVALRSRVTLAAPVLAATAAVVLSQAIAYGSPSVMSAARHVGVIQYVRANHGLEPSLDIYQAWAGLFGGIAWLCDVAGITNPMVVATWWPSLATAATALATATLARRFLGSTRRAWLAAAVFLLSSSLDIIYFSPQSVGTLLALVVFALAVGPRGRRRRRPARAAGGAVTAADAVPPLTRRTRRSEVAGSSRLSPARWCAPLGVGRVAAILFFASVMAVTHQISPYLTVAALVALWLFGYVRPWWTVLLVLVPAIAWALSNTAVLGRFISIQAVGQVFANVKSPTHAYSMLPEPAVTKLAFDVPAAALALVGVLAVFSFLRHRARSTWALLVAAASPATLLVATNYGQEGIFRVALFAAPWLAILVAGIGARTQRGAARQRRPRSLRLSWSAAVGLTTALAVLLAVNVYGQTALDWNRVVAPDASAATNFYETTAPTNSLLLMTGTGDAAPVLISAGYLDHSYVSREDVGGYPSPTSPYDAAADVRTLTQRFSALAPASAYYALVSTSIGAYDERYGEQTYANYVKFEKAMAVSPEWEKVYAGPTTVLYRLRDVQAARGGAAVAARPQKSAPTDPG